MHRFFLVLLAAGVLVVDVGSAFLVQSPAPSWKMRPSPAKQPVFNRQSKRLALPPDVDKTEDTIECFVVGETPDVVCTSEPDDYAWYNGIDPEQLKPTDAIKEGAVECVEGESRRGKPEWECK
jgi:hypothetical protein